MITFAQNFEDVMLARLFPDRGWGFYVDVGAGDPEYLSVTKWFYDQGWSGINIEPNSTLYAKLVGARPRDVNLDCAAGAAPGTAPFFEADINEFSTLGCSGAREQGFVGATRSVKILTLTEILARYVAGRHIDFLKIDVEGSEQAVLSGLDLQCYRPTVILVEATAPHTRIETASQWENLLTEAGYLDVYFDGLNRFYVAKENEHLRTHFLLPPNVFDAISDGRTVAKIQRLQTKIAENDREIAKLGSFDAQLRPTSEGVARLESRLNQLEESIQRRMYLLEVTVQSRVNRLEETIGPALATIERLESRAEQLNQILTRPSVPLRILRRLHRTALPRRIWRRAVRDFKPNLFTPRQHRPRPLRIPARYARDIAPRVAPPMAMVTPSLNQARFIGATIDSVLSQNYPNMRYIVQDGKSADNTIEVLRRYGSRIEWASEVDHGQAHAINCAFARSTDSELMAYLNSDDILLPGTLAYVAKAFARYPNIDLVYGHRIFIDEHGREIGRCVLPEHDPESLLWADYVPQETLFWRRRVWRDLGPLDETFSYALDWDFILRAQQAGFKLKRLPRFLAAFRVHEGQKTWSWMEIGEQEMDRLRQRSFGREVTRTEIDQGVKGYMSRHVRTNLRWRYGFARF
jgi:FkbM family methyltransferase